MILNQFTGANALEIGTYDSGIEKISGTITTTGIGIAHPVAYSSSDSKDFVAITLATVLPMAWTFLGSGKVQNGIFELNQEVFVAPRIQGLRVPLASNVTTILAGQDVYWDPVAKNVTNNSAASGVIKVRGSVFSGDCQNSAVLISGYTGKVAFVSSYQ